mmetsp:Transcript_54917/g.125029  ORF Transcript_54917/g.125029 Transcript_54917/m.125029 type:complete len:215 (+) Transcript_54917:1296-1940(+)
MRWPGVLPAGFEAKFASLIDLPPTLLAAGRAPIPASYAGLDLLQKARRPGAPAPVSPAAAGVGLADLRVCAAATDLFGLGLVTARWKLTYYPHPPRSSDDGWGSGRAEVHLFDLAADPGEHLNLWIDPWTTPATPGSAPFFDAARRAGPLLTEALLRWRAGQTDLSQMWSQVTRGARYVGGFTARAFALIENATGLAPEAALQRDCRALERLGL